MKNLTSLSAHLLYSHDTDVRRYIPDKFGKIGKAVSLRSLGRVLRDPNEISIVRIECAESIGKIGEGLEYLKGLSHDNDNELRRTIIWSLGQIGNVSCLPEIEQYLHDDYWMCKKWIPKSLSRIPCDVSETLLWKFTNLISDMRIISEIFRALTSFHNANYTPQIPHWRNLAKKFFGSQDLSFAQLQSIIRFIKAEISKDEWTDGTIFVKSLYQNGNIPIKLEIISALSGDIEFLIHCLDQTINKKLRREILYNLGCKGYKVKCLNENDVVALVNGLLNSECPLSEIQELLNTLSPSKDKDILQLRLKLKLGLSFDKAMQYYRSSIFKSHILRYIPKSHWNYIEFLRNEAIFAEKKIREIVIEILSTLLSQGKQECCEIVHNVAQNDRIWHIRRDCRKLAQKYCLT